MSFNSLMIRGPIRKANFYQKLRNNWGPTTCFRTTVLASFIGTSLGLVAVNLFNKSLDCNPKVAVKTTSDSVKNIPTKSTCGCSGPALTQEINSILDTVEKQQAECAQFLIDYYSRTLTYPKMAEVFVSNNGELRDEIFSHLINEDAKQYYKMNCHLHQGHFKSHGEYVGAELTKNWKNAGIKSVKLEHRFENPYIVVSREKTIKP